MLTIRSILWGIKKSLLELQFSGVSKRLKAKNFYAGTLGKFCPINELLYVPMPTHF